MRSIASDVFHEEYARLPVHIQKRADKTLRLLLANWRHPSLRTKKMEGGGGYFEARVTRGYRIIFRIKGGAYLLLHVGSHDIERKI